MSKQDLHIKVELNDANVELWGKFSSNLVFVRGLEGRTYNQETKTWTVPMDSMNFADARAKAKGQFDIWQRGK